MKTAAIIAEYNPFHNGHLYQIEETKRRTGADYILILMSGDFVQRGAPALCNKYIRTEAALLNGADAVIELPALYAVSSAEYFAQGSIALLNRLNIVNVLSFGSEADDIALLNQCARLLLEEPNAYRSVLLSGLGEGLSYPLARQKALNSMGVSEEISGLLSGPNNILGLEYCKALMASHSRIAPFTLKRAGSGYHEASLQTGSSPLSSATAIRNAIDFSGKSCNRELMRHLPQGVYELLEKNQVLSHPVRSNDFSSLLHYRLLTMQEEGYASYLDCSSDFSDKIRKNLPSFNSYTDFCSLLKSKNLTYTRISRILLHILLSIKTPASYCIPTAGRCLPVFYARLLGFRKASSPLLSEIKKNSSIPLLSKLADADSLLSEEGRQLLHTDIRCSDIYEAQRFHLTGIPALNEFRQSPVIL